MTNGKWSKPLGPTDLNYWLLRRWISDAYAVGYLDGCQCTPYEMGCPDSEQPAINDISGHQALLRRAEKCLPDGATLLKISVTHDV